MNELTMCVRKKGFLRQSRLQAVEGTCNRHSSQTEACKTCQFESLADGAASRQDDG